MIRAGGVRQRRGEQRPIAKGGADSLFARCQRLSIASERERCRIIHAVEIPTRVDGGRVGAASLLGLVCHATESCGEGSCDPRPTRRIIRPSLEAHQATHHPLRDVEVIGALPPAEGNASAGYS